MDYDTYRNTYFTNPRPEPRYRFAGRFGITLYYEDYEQAVQYYERVLGPPGYVQGKGTTGWEIGKGWLTLLKGKAGSPRNVEVTFVVDTPPEAERLQGAFLAAGGIGPAPTDQLMYEPVRSCPVVDPFGTEILVISPLQTEANS